ncbi:MAG: hypothetical protein Q4D99_01535, partial [Bacillota bacterium]|nr:hypothetical protein [Bacillota bacterium]
TELNKLGSGVTKTLDHYSPCAGSKDFIHSISGESEITDLNKYEKTARCTICVHLAFVLYRKDRVGENGKRITSENREYLMDNAAQVADHIEILSTLVK